MPLFVHDGSLANCLWTTHCSRFLGRTCQKSKSTLSNLQVLSNCKPEQFSDPRKLSDMCNVAFGTDGVAAELPSGSAALQAPEMRRQHWSKKIWFWMLFGCRLSPLHPQYEHLRPSHQEFLIFWPKFNMSWISSFCCACGCSIADFAGCNRDATLTSLLAYAWTKRGIALYALWFLSRLLGYEFIWYTATGQVYWELNRIDVLRHLFLFTR